MLCARFLFFFAGTILVVPELKGAFSHRTLSIGVKARFWRASSPLASNSDKGSLPIGVCGQSRGSFSVDLSNDGCGGGFIWDGDN